MSKNKSTQYYTAGKFAEMVGVSKNTILRWDRENKFNPKKRHGLFRLYSIEQVKEAKAFREENRIRYGGKCGYRLKSIFRGKTS